MQLHLSYEWWAGFLVLILFFLALDLGIFKKKEEIHRAPTFREALSWTALWVSLALGFNGFIHYRFGLQPAQEFLSGYLLEYALSVDNLFVFILVFRAFRVKPEHQHRVLFWGILGALIMRAIFIGAGVALINRFHWITYVFGAFLLFTAGKLLKEVLSGGKDPKGEELHLQDNWFLKLARKYLPIRDGESGGHFTVRIQGKRYFTPLFLVLLVVESTDVIFAVDSIPAVLGVTQDPFIVFTSNVFAILGLRSLYFALAGVIEKFHFLPHALAFILGFVGVKMCAVDLIKVPVSVSLGVIIGSLATAIVASIFHSRRSLPG